MNTRASWQKPWILRPAASAQANTPLWSPTQLSGLVAFWRADAGVTAPGGNVSAWGDQSGNGNTLAITGTGNPQFGATGFNASFPGITLGATQSFLQTVANVALATATLGIFALVQGAGSFGAGTERFISIISNTTGDDFTTPSASLLHFPAGSFEFFSNAAAGGSVAVSGSAPALIGATANGATVAAYLNGAAAGTPSAFTSALGSSPNTLALGSRAGGAVNVVAATFAFAVIWTGLQGSDATNLKAYSNANWGTTFP